MPSEKKPIRVGVSVQSRLEAQFIQTVIAPTFSEHIHWFPFISGSQWPKDYKTLRKDIMGLLGSCQWVTTFYNLGTLPTWFPGMSTSQPLDLRLEQIQNTFQADINHAKFIPYIQPYELEAFFFADPQAISRYYEEPELLNEEFQLISTCFETPEQINGSPQTLPSHRLEGLCGSYFKPLQGYLGVRHLDLAQIKKRCPHFSHWLTLLKAQLDPS